MKLAILSCSPRCYSTRRLREAAEHRGFKVKVLDTLKFAIDLKQAEPDLFFRQKSISDYDAVLPRIGASITYFGTAVVRQFEQMDILRTPPRGSQTPATNSAVCRSSVSIRSASRRRHSSAIKKTCCLLSNESAEHRSSSSCWKAHRGSACCSRNR